MALKDIVNKYLEDTGISRRELAKRAGLSPQTITNILNEDRQVDVSTYQKLAKAMGKAPSELFAEEAAMEPDEEAELMEYLQELRTRPEMKMLFDSSRHMSIDQVKAIVAMIERFRDT